MWQKIKDALRYDWDYYLVIVVLVIGCVVGLWGVGYTIYLAPEMMHESTYQDCQTESVQPHE